MATILSRPVRLARGKPTGDSVDEGLFQDSEEHQLWAAAQAAARDVRPDMSIRDFLEVLPALVHNALSSLPCPRPLQAALQVASKLEQPTNDFFDKVFVMCEDEAVRNNRMALLNRVASLSRGIVDLTVLPGY